MKGLQQFTDFFWLIPLLPLGAAAIISILPARFHRLATSLSIATMILSAGLALVAFSSTLNPEGNTFRLIKNFDWLTFGQTSIRLGLLLDPLSALTGLMVTVVSSLIFIYSASYMSIDPNRTRFF